MFIVLRNNTIIISNEQVILSAAPPRNWRSRQSARSSAVIMVTLNNFPFSQCNNMRFWPLTSKAVAWDPVSSFAPFIKKTPKFRMIKLDLVLAFYWK